VARGRIAVEPSQVAALVCAMVRTALVRHPYHGSRLDPNSVSLHAGETVTVLNLSADGHWASVQVHDGRRGWVAMPCLELGPEAVAKAPERAPPAPERSPARLVASPAAHSMSPSEQSASARSLPMSVQEMRAQQQTPTSVVESTAGTRSSAAPSPFAAQLPTPAGEDDDSDYDIGPPPTVPSQTIIVHPDHHHAVTRQITDHIAEKGQRKAKTCWNGCFAGLERSVKYSAAAAAIAGGVALVVHAPIVHV